MGRVGFEGGKWGDGRVFGRERKWKKEDKEGVKKKNKVRKRKKSESTRSAHLQIGACLPSLLWGLNNEDGSNKQWIGWCIPLSAYQHAGQVSIDLLNKEENSVSTLSTLPDPSHHTVTETETKLQGTNQVTDCDLTADSSRSTCSSRSSEVHASFFYFYILQIKIKTI